MCLLVRRESQKERPIYFILDDVRLLSGLERER